MASAPTYLLARPWQVYQAAIDQNISEPVRFNGVEFREPVSFRGVTFEQGVIFSRCVFCEPVTFEGVHFRGTARFYKCVFRKTTDFTYAVVEPSEEGEIGSIYNGEANFSWSRFEGPANFWGARFKGDVFFWRTIFRGETNLESFRFDSKVTFEGDRALVCLHALDFANPEVFYELHKAGLLSQDQDDPFCANMPEIGSVSKLEERLKKAGWSADIIQQATRVYSQCSIDMFSELGASFQGAYFVNPEAAVFRNVNLKACRFANSNVAGSQFQNVQWDRQPTFLGASPRRAVCDERTATSIGALRAVGKLYYELRWNCEERGLFEEASDFHYGEMETKCRSRPRLLRHTSLAAFYRYLSGYGERPGLALFWLVAAIFVLFPLLYLLTGFSHNTIAAVLHSLETSTFLEAPKSAVEASIDAAPILSKFVTGLERIAVPVQAGMFAIAVQRKFARR